MRVFRLLSMLFVGALVVACGAGESQDPPSAPAQVDPPLAAEKAPPIEGQAEAKPSVGAITGSSSSGSHPTGASLPQPPEPDPGPSSSGSRPTGASTPRPPKPDPGPPTTTPDPSAASTPPEPVAEPRAEGIDAWLAALPTEALVFNTPPRILYGEQVELRLIVQPGEEGAALQATFEASRKASQSGEVQVAEARMSEEVGATLVSPGLAVTALTPERQFVSRVEPTEWRWAVQGSAEGQHELTLSLYAILPEHTSVRVLKTFERSLDVEVPPRQAALGFVKDNWEWMWTFLLAPIGGWAWSRWRRRGEG